MLITTFPEYLYSVVEGFSGWEIIQHTRYDIYTSTAPAEKYECQSDYWNPEISEYDTMYLNDVLDLFLTLEDAEAERMKFILEDIEENEKQRAKLQQHLESKSYIISEKFGIHSGNLGSK